MSNLTIYNKFREVPQEAKKEIGAGRLKGFTDINPMWRIKMLTEQFGVCGFGWYFDIVEQKLENGSDGQKSAFVTSSRILIEGAGHLEMLYSEKITEQLSNLLDLFRN